MILTIAPLHIRIVVVTRRISMVSRCYRCRSFISFLLANAPTLHSIIYETSIAHRCEAFVAQLDMRLPLPSSTWGFRTTLSLSEGPVTATGTRAVRAHNLLQMWVTNGLQLLKNLYIQAIGLSSAKFQHKQPCDTSGLANAQTCILLSPS